MKGQHRIKRKGGRGVAWRALATLAVAATEVVAYLAKRFDRSAPQQRHLAISRSVVATGMLASVLFSVGVGVAATSAGADAGGSVTGSPYNASDGVLDTTPAGTITHHADLLSGNSDNIFGSSPQAKEQQTCPTIRTGPVDSKSDLTDFWIGEAPGTVPGSPPAHYDFLYLAWKRVATTGDANIDFELNQSTHTACVGPTVNHLRTAGDLLIQYDFASTTGTTTLSVYDWVTSGTCDIGSITTYGGCWRLNPLSSGAVQASVSTTKSFGEAVINLQASGIFPPGVCKNLVSGFAKSRASTSADSALKDYISPAGVTVENCSPTTTQTTPSAKVVTLGGSPTDSVTVTGNATRGPPAGAVTFYVCANTTTGCDPTSSGAVKLTGTNPVTLTAATGSGADTSTATSPSYTPPAVGNYCFAGVYTPTPNSAIYLGSSDSSADECFQVTPVTPGFTTTSTSPTSTAVGNQWGDSATVTGTSPYGAPSGSVTFTLCKESPPGTACTGGSTLATVTTPTVNGVTSTYTLPTVDDALPTSTGTWCFNAAFQATTGSNYASVGQQADGECFTVTPAPSQTATHISAASVTLSANGTVSDNVTVAGNGAPGSPTGTVDFYVCQTSTSTTALTAGTCSVTGAPQTSGPKLTGTGTNASGQPTSGAASGSFTPKAAGSYCFAAVYSGDTNYAGSQDNSTSGNADANECVLVGKAGTTTSTVVYDATSNLPSAAAGEAAPASTYDTATVTGIDGVSPTGYVT